MTQNYANHEAIPAPLYIGVLVILLAEVGVRIADLVGNPMAWRSWWAVLVAAALALSLLLARRCAQIVQDRTIRDAMLVRLGRVLDTPLAARIGELSLRQLIALRFASDAELPSLTARTLDGSLATPDAIKRAISAWQSDTLRV
jgi:hypothetical protein